MAGDITPDGIISAARARGYVLTLEQLEATLGRLMAQAPVGGELADDALEQVVGGTSFSQMGFQNFDQKANQTYQLMSSLTKAMNESRSSVLKKML